MKENILLKKTVLTLLILIIARVGIFIPIPGIDHDSFYLAVNQNTFVNFLNIFSGGGFSTIGLFALGIVPYINASLVIQLLTKIIPQLENLQKEEGEIGRKKITQYTRILTLIWAIIQSYIISIWIKPYVFLWNSQFLIDIIFSLTAGSMIIMWLSERITEKGIGNGASLLIFQNIVSGIPENLKNSVNAHDQSLAIQFGLLAGLFLLMLIITILVQEGVRKITIISARQISKTNTIDPQSYLPLKLNQGGVMPIIFASASMAIPSYLQAITEGSFMEKIISWILSNGLAYSILYGILIISFSYFYSSLVLNTVDMTKNLQKMGASIPNIRPGEDTNLYLIQIINRLTFMGASFLFFVALVPSLIPRLTGITTFKGLGATSLLILVGVSVDTAKQIQTYLISEQYKNMMK